VLPAAGGVDGRAAPDARGAIEIEEGAAAGASAMFDDEMAVQKNGFDASEQGIVGVQIGPARLHHADFFAAVGIHEIRNGAAKEIGPRDEVGVKDGNEFALGGVKTIFERAGFVTFAIGAMDVNNGETARSVAFDAGTGDVARFVGGIIEDLDA